MFGELYLNVDVHSSWQAVFSECDLSQEHEAWIAATDCSCRYTAL